MADVWDKTTPLGTEAISLGDDRIRELKSALETALSHEGTFPGASPSTAPIFIPHLLSDTTANRPTGDDLVSGRFFYNTTLKRIERYNGASWDPVSGGIGIESGTKMLFYQAAAPTGWTAVAVNDKFLRVVNAGGTGGTTGGSGSTPSTGASLAHTHTVASHTHSISSDGGHSHTVNSHTHDLGNHTHTIAHTHSVPYAGWATSAASGSSGKIFVDTGTGGQFDGSADNTSGASSAANSGVPSSNTSGATAPGTDSQGAHTHTGATGAATPATDSQLSTLAFQYADVIVATKD